MLKYKKITNEIISSFNFYETLIWVKVLEFDYWLSLYDHLCTILSFKIKR